MLNGLSQREKSRAFIRYNFAMPRYTGGHPYSLIERIDHAREHIEWRWIYTNETAVVIDERGLTKFRPKDMSEFESRAYQEAIEDATDILRSASHERQAP